MKKKLYKILVDGKSCHGGDLKWSLPSKGKKGNWHTVDGNLKICSKGIHLTTKPFMWYKWGCTAYEAEAKDIISWEEDKCVCRSVRLVKEIKHPKWWTNTIGWIGTLKNIAWLKPDGKPNKEWRLFETRAAARDAARAAAWAAARDAAWAAAWAAARAAAGDAARDAAWAAAGDAARDAALQSRMILTSDLKVESKHRVHVQKRMEVWQKGYGLLCDVGGVLYVYKKI